MNINNAIKAIETNIEKEKSLLNTYKNLSLKYKDVNVEGNLIYSREVNLLMILI